MRNLKLTLSCLGFILLGVCLNKAYASQWDISTQAGMPARDSSMVPARSSTALTTQNFLAFSGVGVVYGMHLSSGVAGDFVILRDSGTANNSSTVLTSVQFGSSDARVQFNPPLRILNGLSANASTCLGGLGTNAVYGRCYTILYDTP